MFPVQNAWVSHFFSQKSSSWHFLALAKLRSTAQVGNQQRIPNSWIKVDCRLSHDSFLANASLQGDSAAFLATNTSQRDLQPAYSTPIKVLLSLCKVVRFRNFLHTWLPRRLSLVGADTSNKSGLSGPKYSWTKKEISWLRAHGTFPSRSHLLAFLGLFLFLNLLTSPSCGDRPPLAELRSFHVRALECSLSEKKSFAFLTWSTSRTNKISTANLVGSSSVLEFFPFLR